MNQHSTIEFRGKTAKLQRQNSDKFAAIHGMRQTPTGNSWSAMMSRCFNPRYNVYQYYGARGITVCEYIKQSPCNLVALIGERLEGTTIDRINGSGNYSCGKCDHCKLNGWPLNVRWATRKEQNSNKESNVYVEIYGQIKTASEWSDIFGIKRATLFNRIKRGWSGAWLISPLVEQTRLITINGVTKSLEVWAKTLGINKRTLAKRIKKGWKENELLLPKQNPRQVHKFYDT